MMESRSRLALVPIVESLDPITPILMTEKVAAKYLGVNRHAFRQFVFDGLILGTNFPNGKRRIYWKKHLDDFAASLDWQQVKPGKPTESTKK